MNSNLKVILLLIRELYHIISYNICVTTENINLTVNTDIINFMMLLMITKNALKIQKYTFKNV
jgi:hypothetical protein